LTAQAQQREKLLNVAFWLDNPSFHKADHRNGLISLVWAMLAVPPIGKWLVSEGVRLSHVGPRPYDWRGHLRNVARSPFSTASTISEIFRSRFVTRPRKPGFLLRNREGRYTLHYHAEQVPNRQSRLTLSDRLDATGLPYLDVRLHFSEQDADSVVRSHEVLDTALRHHGIGRLEYQEPELGQRLAAVASQASDGFHQIGATRMGRNASQGVVDCECRVHGVDNLWIAGSSVLPTSGQANPTFVAAALGIRLAETLAHKAGAQRRQSALEEGSASEREAVRNRTAAIPPGRGTDRLPDRSTTR
jgi:choline dehydrogenase-like flavoprotein